MKITIDAVPVGEDCQKHIGYRIDDGLGIYCNLKLGHRGNHKAFVELKRQDEPRN